MSEKKTIPGLSCLVPLILLGGVVWFIWMWGFCRLYVAPGKMAVITSKIGDPLPPDQILANEGQKGIRANVLGEGRYFLNPIFYDWEFFDCQRISPGQVGIVTSKVGAELPQGEFLADDDQKGIWRRVLGPGTYRINPYGYVIETTPAVSIPIGYAGVITSLSGKQADAGAFAEPGQKGVREDILQPGLYFLNPREFRVDVLEIGVSQVSMLKAGGRVFTKAQLAVQNDALQELNLNMLEQQAEKRERYLQKSGNLFSSRSDSRLQERGNYRPQTAEAQDQRDLQRVPQQYRLGNDMASLGLAQVLEFPSRDGFPISLDMTVEFELHPRNIAWIFRTYGDLPAVLDKIIVPQISSVARNKGSEYGARDFVAGDARSVFQSELTSALKATLESKNILIHNALIRHVSVPMQILEPIQQVGLAIEQDLTNKERQNTAKKLAELNTELTLIEQRKQEVAEETKKIRAEIRADQDLQVATIRADTQKQVAEIRKQTAGMDANRVRLLGTAKADAYERVAGARADGLGLKARAMGDPEAYTLWEFAMGLPQKLKLQIIHAGDGTLWTDLKTAAELGGAMELKK